MLKAAVKFKHNPLIAALIFTLILGLINLNNKSHFLFNLEPYPDGLLYVDVAKNIAMKNTAVINYYGSEYRLRVPIGYPLFLSFFYFILRSPESFYFANLTLLLTSITFFYLIISKKIKYFAGKSLAMLVFLAHPYLFWLISIPICENAGITLFVISIYLLTIKSKLINTFFVSLSISSLVWLKYNYIFVAMVLGLALIYKLRKNKNYLNWSIVSLTISFSALLFFLFHLWNGHNLLGIFFDLIEPAAQNTLAKLDTSSADFYSFKNIWPNLIFYTKSLLGFKNKFLWLNYPLSSGAILFLAILGFKKAFNKKKYFIPLTLILTFFAQFLLQLIFVSKDTRYISLSIPIIAILGSYAFAEIKNKINQKFLIFFILIFIQLLINFKFYQQIIAANIFSRTQGWQYQAVMSFNNYFVNNESTQNNYVITALPPLLIDLYGNNNYRVLPLSERQEFISKDDCLWGEEISCKSLPKVYEKILAENKNLYISNAYITHQHEVVSDYEKLRKEFNLTKVQSGCLETCNLFKISHY